MKNVSSENKDFIFRVFKLLVQERGKAKKARLKFHCAEMFGAITAQCSFSSSEKPAAETAESYFDDGNVPPFSNAPRRASLIIVDFYVIFSAYPLVFPHHLAFHLCTVASEQ